VIAYEKHNTNLTADMLFQNSKQNYCLTNALMAGQEILKYNL